MSTRNREVRANDLNRAFREMKSSKCKHNFMIVGIGKAGDTSFVISVWCAGGCGKQLNIDLNLFDAIKHKLGMIQDSA